MTKTLKCPLFCTFHVHVSYLISSFGPEQLYMRNGTNYLCSHTQECWNVQRNLSHLAFWSAQPTSTSPKVPEYSSEWDAQDFYKDKPLPPSIGHIGILKLLYFTFYSISDPQNHLNRVHIGENAPCCFLPVCRAARRYGLKEAMEGEDWTLFWTDCSVSLDRVRDMKRYQVLHWIDFMLSFGSFAFQMVTVYLCLTNYRNHLAFSIVHLE